MTVVWGDIMGTSGEMTFGRLDRLPFHTFSVKGFLAVV